MQPVKRSAILFFCAMLVAIILAFYLTPHRHFSEDASPVDLARMIPEHFGSWEMLPQSSATIINPELNDLLSTVYQQMLARYYRNKQGQIVMLSISYGQRQIDDGSLHLPEVCYPAQGFTVTRQPRSTVIETSYGPLKATQLSVSKDQRDELITYWTMLGTKNVSGWLETKSQQLNYGFHNSIPDGLIFRFSTLGMMEEQNQSLHQEFVKALLQHLSATDRLRLTGLGVQSF